MKITYLIILIVGGYLIFSYIRVVAIIKLNTLPKISTENQTLGSGSTLVYVAAGDSTGVGVGSSSIDNAYTYQVAQKLSETRQVYFYNVSVSGAKTEDVINSQLKQIIRLQPDIVTLSVGANDITHLKMASVTIKNLKTIIAALERETKAQIYVANMPILKDAPLLPKLFRIILEVKAKKINANLEKLSSDRVKIVPIHDYGWDQFPDLKITFASDQFHPSDIGYKNWTNAYLTTMNLK